MFENTNCGFGNDWAWIIILLLFGWGRNGFGNNNGVPCATQADVRSAVDQQTLISKLDQQTYGLADSTYALTNTITNGFHGVDSALCNGFGNLSAQLANCCCENRAAIADVKYAMCTNTRDIIDNANANSRAILDFLTNDKISTLTTENQALKFQASQAAQNSLIFANMESQTAELIRRLGRDVPVPAYVVPNPNCCYPTGCAV